MKLKEQCKDHANDMGHDALAVQLVQGHKRHEIKELPLEKANL